MRVLRVNEPMCPRCGRGRRSGYQYPACADLAVHGMPLDEAHSVFCHGFSKDLCAACKREGGA